MTELVITGCSGFVGTNLTLALAKIPKISITTTDIKLPQTIPENVKYIKADILDYPIISEILKGKDIVIHLSANPLPLSLKDTISDMNVNIKGTLNLLESMRKNDVKKIIFSSASSVVGKVQYNPVDELHPCTPLTPYAVSKLASEHYIRVYSNLYNLEYFIFRFFNIYGEHLYPESGALIPNVIKKIHNDEPVTVAGDGKQTRDFVYVNDLIKCYIDVIKKDLKNELINLGTGKAQSIMDVINLCTKIIGKMPKINYVEKRPGEIDNFVADTKKFHSIFGYIPSTTLENGIKMTYNWLKGVL